MQVLALIVIIVGFIFTLPFQIFVREKANVNLKKLEWYKWLQNPQFYLVIRFIASTFMIDRTTENFRYLHYRNNLCP